MANVTTRRTRSDKGVSRTSTLDGWIGVFMSQTSEARRVWIGVMTALDQQLRDGVIVRAAEDPEDETPADKADLPEVSE